ncbi:COP9 signalosome complex subunit 7 [Aspergillus flavus]|nr:COP9 signalosome subunit 7 (CsnG) [Aspergillus flavus]RAQ50699.1 COP9 signalosome complex subunit 7 [Aspergillus flavus]
MDQTHSRAMEALQPFVLLANSNSATSPKFVANLITNATSSPNTYVFAELLETPTVQALRSEDTPAEYQGYLTLLEVFAWGTWQDYQTTPNLPPLNNEQTLKLRLLSLLSLSATIKPLTYQTLMDALSIAAPSELESLVTTAIYSSLITARLSPVTNPPTINVTSVAPLRDVKPQSLTTMISILTQWETRCGDVISDIEAEIARIKTNSAKRRAKEQARAVLFEKTLSNWGSDGGESNPRFPGSKKQSWHGGAKGGSSGFVGNKREFSGDDFDDGYWDNGADGAYDSQFSTSKMDIDQGAGSSATGSAGAGARHAKRVLGRKS